ncbi:MAG: type II secretion system protein GspK [Rhodoferax sp.]
MSLIITGIVQAVRNEIRSTGNHRQAMVGGALADAAILLALQSLSAQQQESRNIQVIPVQFEGQVFEVSVQPLNGLIDINNASVQLLAEMYRHAGELNPQAAQILAQATTETRQRKNSRGVAQGFDAVEDLMRVPAMTYDLYAKISLLLTVDLKASGGRVNPMAAPVGVLQILTGGDMARATALAAGRSADLKMMDTSFLKPDLIETATSRSLRLQVRSALPGGGTVERSWHVFLRADPRSGLPWRLLRKEQTSQHTVQSSS